MPNLRWSFSDSRMRVEDGGWSRQTTIRELPVATELAGVNMRLEAGGVRELHFHNASEWAYMIRGQARITAVDNERRTFADDVAEGDLWFFPRGIPHSIQGMGADGCEFLLVFDDAHFDENATVLLSEWLGHTPREVLAKNFGVSENAFAHLPEKPRYIFQSREPAPLTADRIVGTGLVPEWFSYRLLAQQPTATRSGTVRVVDSRKFAASKAIAAALVEVEPGGLRELHWHPNGDEWQYYLAGKGRMTVFAAGRAATFEFKAGDVGYVPKNQGHYVENTGTTALRFLETFRSDRFEDISLAHWLALTPHELVEATVGFGEDVLSRVPPYGTPIVPP